MHMAQQSSHAVCPPKMSAKNVLSQRYVPGWRGMAGEKPASGADVGWSPHRLPSFVGERGHLVNKYRCRPFVASSCVGTGYGVDVFCRIIPRSLSRNVDEHLGVHLASPFNPRRLRANVLKARTKPCLPVKLGEYFGRNIPPSRCQPSDTRYTSKFVEVRESVGTEERHDVVFIHPPHPRAFFSRNPLVCACLCTGRPLRFARRPHRMRSTS